MMNTRPQTIGYSLVDSPVGMAAWTYEKIAQWALSGGEPERVLGRDAIPTTCQIERRGRLPPAIPAALS